MTMGEVSNRRGALCFVVVMMMMIVIILLVGERMKQ